MSESCSTFQGNNPPSLPTLPKRPRLPRVPRTRGTVNTNLHRDHNRRVEDEWLGGGEAQRGGHHAEEGPFR